MYYVTKTVVDNTEDVLVGIGDTNDDSEEFYPVERVPYILSVTLIYGITIDVAIGFDNYLYRRGHDTYRICLNQLYGDFDTKVQVLHNVDARVKSGVLNFLDLSFCDFSSLPIYSFCKELAPFAVRSLTGKSDYRLCIDDSFTYRWNLFIG